ncbi:hypothetical protein F66182_5161 [Fusarium sp. NRRL 66182]|nr:hypothetical protein F66182_5161 [Fusarium sp. NRRL 66182]
MLAQQTRAVLNYLFGRQYAGIPRDIDTDKSTTLDERAPVVITKTKMASRLIVIPAPTTIVVTHIVPANNTLSTSSGPLPPALTAPGIDLTPVPKPDPPVDGPLFASLILPTSQGIEPVPTTSPGGEVVPEASDTNASETIAPTEPIAQPTSQAAPQETPADAQLIDPALTAQPTTQEAPQETPAEARLIEEQEPALGAQPTSQEAPQETPTEARLVDGQDAASTTAQQTTQEPPKETPEEVELVVVSDSTSSFSSSSSSAEELLLFDTESLTFTGPPHLSTTFQTRVATTTDAYDPDYTQSPDGAFGNSGGFPSLTTATLSGGVLTTIGLDATADSDHASETEGSESVVVNKEADTAPTPVVVGSIVGSIMGVSMLAFVIFLLMRRRSLKRRRSTLLTPLGIPFGTPGAPGGGGGGNEKYEIDNQSLGPTPRSTKVAAAMSANVKKIGQRFRQSMTDSGTVDMNRGNSQFLDENSPDSRNVSMARAPSRVSTPGGGHQGWWSRLIEESSVENLAAAHAVPMPEKETEARRAASPNPFSDAASMHAMPHEHSYANNALSQDSLVPPPLAPARPSRPNDSFYGRDSILPPGPLQLAPMSYKEPGGQPRVRNLTPQGQTGEANLAPPVHKEAWRGNVHSNPFDLELDGRDIPSVDNYQPLSRNTMASSVYSVPKRTTVRHSRAESYTSRYTSGVSSIGEWPPVPSLYGQYNYNGTEFPLPPRHSRSESDGALRRQTLGQAM